MNFGLTDEQELIRRTVRDFAVSRVAPVAEELDVAAMTLYYYVPNKDRLIDGMVDIVFGEVVQIHIRDDVVLPSGKLDIARIAPIARLGYYDYCVVRETFEMVIPVIDPRSAGSPSPIER